MLSRDDWQDLARQVDWQFTYVTEEEVFPACMAGCPWLPNADWKDWDEPFRTTYREYVDNQQQKDASVRAVRDAVGKLEDFQHQAAAWLDGLKLHSATLALTEFAAVIGELRGARFGRSSAWRTMAVLGALDELRHTQIPLMLMHELVRYDPQFDWTHKLLHTDEWIAIAARHLIDELLLGSNAIEFAVATNFVFETGFTNLQFVGLSALAHRVGDPMFEKMVRSIQTDEARHAQIGRSVLIILAEKDREYAQALCDKWFWRSWLLFAIVTGFAMDYFTPLDRRDRSFKEFMEEWVLEQYARSLDDLGLQRPWYWDTFLDSIDSYHHMVYLSAYTYRRTVWFDFVMPGPDERAWLRRKYPRHWEELEPAWEQVAATWRSRPPGDEAAVHGTAMVAFCDLCQLVLSGGTPRKNSARTVLHDGRRYVFCSAPCQWIFEKEPERYRRHESMVSRILSGAAPASLFDLVVRHFGLDPETWGKDAFGGVYPWLSRAGAEE